MGDISIDAVRQQYPQYSDLTDQQIGDGLYGKFYSDIPRSEFDARIGLRARTDNLGSAIVKAVTNAPGQIDLGVQGLLQAGNEAATNAISPAPPGNDALGPVTPGAPIGEMLKGPPANPTPINIPVMVPGFDPVSKAGEGALVSGAVSAIPGATDFVSQAAAKGVLSSKLYQLYAREGQQKPDVAPGSFADILSQAAGMAVQAAPAIAAGIITRQPEVAAAGIGTVAAGQSYGQAREQGVPVDQAAGYAAAIGAVNGITADIPIAQMMKPGGAFLAKIGTSAIQAGVSNAIAAGLSSLIDKGVIKPDMTWGEAWTRIKDAGLTGLIVGPVLAVAGHGFKTGTDTVSQSLKDASSAVINTVKGALNVPADLIGNTWMAVHALKDLPLSERVAAYAAAKAQGMGGAVSNDNAPAEAAPVAPAAEAAPHQEAAPAPVAAPTSSPSVGAFSLIGGREGFLSQAYWDHNHYRVGYGSDTYTTPDGSVHQVTQSTIVTPEEATLDLNRRIGEFQGGIVRDVGSDVWGKLPENAKAALTSMAYNYGHLPHDVAEAVRTGDIETIARAIEGRRGDNNGINAGRRAQEAAIVRGEAMPGGPSGAESGKTGPSATETASPAGEAPTAAGEHANDIAPGVAAREKASEATEQPAKAAMREPEKTAVTPEQAPKLPEITQQVTEAGGKLAMTSDGKSAELTLPKGVDPSIAEPIKSWADANNVRLQPGDEGTSQVLALKPTPPGSKNLPPFQSSGMPVRPASGTVEVTRGRIDLPNEDAPMRRETARKGIIKIIGERLYTGKIKGNGLTSKALGTFDPQTATVRTKGFDDIEVLSHEMAHWLDHGQWHKAIFEPLRKAYATELDPISYTTDPKLVNKEGFAEYVRLWTTNYAEAKARAPAFTKAFEGALKKAGLYDKMTRVQEAAHQFYHQGSMARLEAKQGETGSTPVERVDNFLKSGWKEMAYQQVIDNVHSFEVGEREMTGTISEGGNSPFKLISLARGKESTHEAIIQYGAPHMEPNGDLTFDGKGLSDILKPATENGLPRYRALMRYFSARRAEELTTQGREKLFTSDEIKAGLSLGSLHPEFKDIFAEYQDFNHKILNWMTDMSALAPEQRDAVLERNQSYAPFARVIDHVLGGGSLDGPAIKELFGSTRNIKDIGQSIIENLSQNVSAALIGRAKASFYKEVMNNQVGSEWATEVAPASEATKIAWEQMRSKIGSILRALGNATEMNGKITQPGVSNGSTEAINLDDMQAVLTKHPEMATVFTQGQKPSSVDSYIDAAIVDGKMRFFETKNKLLIDTLVSMKGQRAPKILAPLKVIKHIGTRTVTGALQFATLNPWRDSLDAAVQTESKFTPVYDTVRGGTAYVTQSNAHKLAMLNGALFSGKIQTFTADGRNRALLDLPSRNMFDSIAKAINKYDGLLSVMENSTRIGQFIAANESGHSMTEAAYQGRTVTTDFSKMGSNDLLRNVMSVTAFMNAQLQGNAQLINAMLSKDGRINLAKAGSYQKFAKRALLSWGTVMAAATVALWLRNKDDPRYQALTPDAKSRNWSIWLGDPKDPNDHGLHFPKPFAVGFLFGDLPENILDYAYKHDGKDVAANLAAAFQMHFGVGGWPSPLGPIIEGNSNTEWNGAPIVPDTLKDAPPYMQFRDNTPLIYDAVGKAMNWSPLMGQHYVRGYLGYAAQYMEDGTEALMWDSKAWGPRPFPAGPGQYLLHGVVQATPDYRTKWTDGYNALKQQAVAMAAAYKWAKDNGIKDQSIFKNLTDSQMNNALFALSKVFARMNKGMSAVNQQAMAIKYNPKLEQQQKEDQITALYAQRNSEMKGLYDAAEKELGKYQ